MTESIHILYFSFAQCSSPFKEGKGQHNIFCHFPSYHSMEIAMKGLWSMSRFQKCPFHKLVIFSLFPLDGKTN